MISDGSELFRISVEVYCADLTVPYAKYGDVNQL